MVPIHPPGVPIHSSCVNLPRPVVNFIFFNKTKTEVPEVLKMYTCKAFMHSSQAYIICYNLIAVSMTLLEAIKERGANSPRSPLYKYEFRRNKNHSFHFVLNILQKNYTEKNHLITFRSSFQ